STPQSRVSVNGQPAVRNDREFSAEVALRERINRVQVVSRDKFGERSLTITLVWDKFSFKRYCVRIDDNSFVFTDLARQRPASLFDHFYLRGLKELHEKYGSKFILKCFYNNAHDKEGFNLSMMPDCYRGEFDDNADWLHLAFHAWAEFPDRPYQHCSEERLAHDLDTTTQELKRIAGERACTPPTNVHWAMLAPQHFPFMRSRGVKILTSAGFMSNRIIVDGKLETLEQNACDIGFFYEQDVTHHMIRKRCFYDADFDLFLSRTFFCFNIHTPEEIERKIREEDARNESDVLEAVGHEQYAFPHYSGFLPDYFQRLETCCRVPAELGYRPVFFQDGIFGNPAWENA
ncbi:MAG: hypothetical protein J6S21_00715, partial [Victivallales bacterium]|nr:hypothetical protein [Victivallales bacterium]